MERALAGPQVVFELFGIPITETVVNTWIVMAVLIAFAFIITRKLEGLPKGTQTIAEALVESINDFTMMTMGEDKRWFAPYAGTILLMIMLSNLLGLFALWPPTADVATTIGLALMTFFMVQFFGIKSNGLFGYIKGLVWEPIPIFSAFLNIIGELANPVSMAFRLFGNILAGVVIMGLIYGSAPILIPVPLHIYFDLFAGVIQSFIFTMLTMVFVSMSMDSAT